MPDRPSTASPDPSAPEHNPLGLGPRDHESSNTGSTADTTYDARDSDPYTTGEPQKRFDDLSEDPSPRVGAPRGGAPTPADPDVPSSDEP